MDSTAVSQVGSSFITVHSSEIMVLATCALALITAVYVTLTWLTLREIKRARLAEARPYIVVDIILNDGLFLLSIKNTGKSEAFNVRLSPDRNLTLMFSTQLQEMPLFKKEIPIFPPGREFVITLGQYARFVDEKDTSLEPIFVLDLQYHYLEGHVHKERVPVNLHEFLSTRPHPDALVEGVAKLRADLSKLLSSVDHSLKDIAALRNLASKSGLEISHRSRAYLSHLCPDGKIKIDVNRATAADLVEFAEVPPEVAEQIVAECTCTVITDIEEMRAIQGVTDELMVHLRERCYVSGTRIR